LFVPKDLKSTAVVLTVPRVPPGRLQEDDVVGALQVGSAGGVLHGQHQHADRAAAECGQGSVALSLVPSAGKVLRRKQEESLYQTGT
jgi:hypothetical protein